MKKMCISCKSILPITEFYKDASKKDGRESSCKECRSSKRKEIRLTDPVRLAREREKVRESHHRNSSARKEKMREWYRLNKIRKQEYNKAFYAANKSEFCQRYKRYYAINRSALIERSSIDGVIRKAAKIRAAKLFVPELDVLVFSEAKKLALLRDQMTGIKWHIDHKEPLRGKEVCGLHNAFNIAVVPAAFNLMKSNRQMAGYFEG